MGADTIRPAPFEETAGNERATFVVRIQYRQNATWQGQVTWAEKQQTMPFRSALELLKLIDSTVEVTDWNNKEAEEDLI